MKELKDLTFADDFMFTYILTTKKEICKGLLERLLHIEIADIEYPEKEKTFKAGYDAHGIRVDVFVKDSDRIFDIEMVAKLHICNFCLTTFASKSRRVIWKSLHGRHVAIAHTDVRLAKREFC